MNKNIDRYDFKKKIKLLNIIKNNNPLGEKSSGKINNVFATSDRLFGTNGITMLFFHEPSCFIYCKAVQKLGVVSGITIKTISQKEINKNTISILDDLSIEVEEVENQVISRLVYNSKFSQPGETLSYNIKEEGWNTFSEKINNPKLFSHAGAYRGKVVCVSIQKEQLFFRSENNSFSLPIGTTNKYFSKKERLICKIALEELIPIISNFYPPKRILVNKNNKQSSFVIKWEDATIHILPLSKECPYQNRLVWLPRLKNK